MIGMQRGDDLLMRHIKVWRVYGRPGHRQRESFAASALYTNGCSDSIISVYNYDRTGTHEYTLIGIAAPTASDCNMELDGQLSDGIFENSRTGRVVSVYDSETPVALREIVAVRLACIMEQLCREPTSHENRRTSVDWQPVDDGHVPDEFADIVIAKMSASGNLWCEFGHFDGHDFVRLDGDTIDDPRFWMYIPDFPEGDECPK